MTWASVSPAPTTAPRPLRIARSSGKARRPMSTLGACWRRFMFGYRSVPPATTIASGPCAASMLAASPSDFGAR